MIQHNYTIYSGRITDVGLSVFLETQKILQQNYVLHFMDFAAAK
jgi:hypothetical protein